VTSRREELKPDSSLVILSYHEDKDAGLPKEVAVGTVIQYQQRGSADRHQRWERIERAEQCERYGALGMCVSRSNNWRWHRHSLSPYMHI
jgi:hypothetical protein